MAVYLTQPLSGPPRPHFRFLPLHFRARPSTSSAFTPRTQGGALPAAAPPIGREPCEAPPPTAPLPSPRRKRKRKQPRGGGRGRKWAGHDRKWAGHDRKWVGHDRKWAWKCQKVMFRGRKWALWGRKWRGRDRKWTGRGQKMDPLGRKWSPPGRKWCGRDRKWKGCVPPRSRIHPAPADPAGGGSPALSAPAMGRKGGIGGKTEQSDPK